jgi:hypothetical protein
MALLETPQRSAVTGGQARTSLLDDAGIPTVRRPRRAGSQNILGLLDEKVVPYGTFSSSETYNINTYDPRQISSANLDYILDLVNQAGGNFDPQTLSDLLKSPGRNTFAVSAVDLSAALPYHAVIADESGIAQSVVPVIDIYNNPEAYKDAFISVGEEGRKGLWGMPQLQPIEQTLEDYFQADIPAGSLPPPIVSSPSSSGTTILPSGYPTDIQGTFLTDTSAFDKYMESLYPDIKELYKQGEVSTKTFDEYMKLQTGRVSPTGTPVGKPGGIAL